MDNQEKQSPLSMPVAVVIAGVVIAAAIFASNSAILAPTTTADPAQPALQAGDVSNIQTDGEPFIGNLTAPVTILYWYDYQCPFCQRHEQTVMLQIIKEYVDTGKVKVVFKDYQFLGPDSQTAGLASRAVWETAPSKFYEWHAAMYDKQDEENSGWGSKADVLALTKTVLGAADASKVEQLLGSNEAAYQSEMDADKAEGSALGVNGTPGTIIGTELISGAQPYTVFKQAIDSALKFKN
jgi:protein-disulfide isomerase